MAERAHVSIKKPEAKRETPEFRRDPDRTARQERDVVASIAKVMEITGENFNPSNWTPPGQYRTKSEKK